MLPSLKAWLKAVSATLALAAALGAQIRVDVRLVRVLATVKNPAGELVGALNKEDFEISDNGVPQQIAVFERQTEQPLSVAMLVDASGSTAKDLKYEVDSVVKFFKALFAEGNPKDTVALYSFNYQVTLHNFFTHNQAPLEHSLRTIQGEAGTSLYDAIYFAARELEPRDGRKVMIIVTDGGDTTSVKDFHAALDSAQLANASIYPVLVVPITNDAGRNLGGEHALATMALGTGGRVFQPTLGAALDTAFSDIIKDLRTQYLLAYYPKDVPLTKNRFHRLQVRTHRPDLRVSARNGYYGEAERQESQLRQDQAENPGIALPNKPLKK
ncbi:MAG TPA: VWA domain-containing protein [Bryobacteraceae bacterium]|jgi:Ca-activated chloride channel homolog|nr:VWA domain-containing protein [Bryobacteraceae bacterium]